jgi:hypothetical protein
MRGWLEGVDWRCMAGVMTLVAAAADPAANAADAPAVNGSLTPAAAVDSLGCYLPAGVVPASAVCAVLRHALDALQWTVSEAGSELLQLLRCLRRVWVLLVEDGQLQVRTVGLMCVMQPFLLKRSAAAYAQTC